MSQILFLCVSSKADAQILASAACAKATAAVWHAHAFCLLLMFKYNCKCEQ